MVEQKVVYCSKLKWKANKNIIHFKSQFVVRRPLHGLLRFSVNETEFISFGAPKIVFKLVFFVAIPSRGMDVTPGTIIFLIWTAYNSGNNNRDDKRRRTIYWNAIVYRKRHFSQLHFFWTEGDKKNNSVNIRNGRF